MTVPVGTLGALPSALTTRMGLLGAGAGLLERIQMGLSEVALPEPAGVVQLA